MQGLQGYRIFTILESEYSTKLVNDSTVQESKVLSISLWDFALVFTFNLLLLVDLREVTLFKLTEILDFGSFLSSNVIVLMLVEFNSDVTPPMDVLDSGFRVREVKAIVFITVPE